MNTLDDVRAVYSGPEGRLWELIMGEQIHIGGFVSSMDLAQKAGIKAGMTGVDLCCCSGAGMRFLVQMMNVAHMHGVDATPAMVELGRTRTLGQNFANKISFTLANSCSSGLASGLADFVWGEDAWCYVEDKTKLIAEAAKLVKPGGTIAFTDWVVLGSIANDKLERFLKFMKFSNMQTIEGYTELLTKNNCSIIHAEDTGRFAPCIDLYIRMLNEQFTYDALRILNFDVALLGSLAEEMHFAQQLAHEKVIGQALFVARKDLM